MVGPEPGVKKTEVVLNYKWDDPFPSQDQLQIFKVVKWGDDKQDGFLAHLSSMRSQLNISTHVVTMIGIVKYRKKLPDWDLNSNLHITRRLL